MSAWRQLRCVRAEQETAVEESLAFMGALVFDALECGAAQLLLASPAQPSGPIDSADVLPSAGPAMPARPIAPTSRTERERATELERAPELESATGRARIAEREPTGDPVRPCEAEGPRDAARPAATGAPPAHDEPVQVTPEVLATLRERFSSVAPAPQVTTTSKSQTTLAERQLLDDVLRGSSPLPAPRGSLQARTEHVERLELALARLSAESPLAQATNFNATSWLAARARALQDDDGGVGNGPLSGRFVALFGRLAKHASETRPGIVHGLARGHTPAGATWSVDAAGFQRVLESQLSALGGARRTETGAAGAEDLLRRLLDELRDDALSGRAPVKRLRAIIAAGLSPTDPRLVRAAAPFHEQLKAEPDLKRLRKAAAKHLRQEAENDPPEDDQALLPAGWPLLAVTRGMRVAMVGGEPRPERRQRLVAVFQFAELDWIDGAAANGRQVDALLQRMRQGTVDMVIVLRAFSSHKLSDRVFAVDAPSCRRVLADTYGVLKVRLGLERFMSAEAPEEAPQETPSDGGV